MVEELTVLEMMELALKYSRSEEHSNSLKERIKKLKETKQSNLFEEE